AACPGVRTAALDYCGAAIGTVQGVVDCVTCVSEFSADCVDALSVPALREYPPRCNTVCGDGQKTAGEPCDPSDSTPANQICENSGNGLEDCTGCFCGCPGHFDFVADASHPETLFDVGWTGTAHDQQIVSGAKVTVTCTGCETPEKPCGVCSFTGPIANTDADAGDIEDRRCTNDTSIECTSNAPCTGGG